MKVMSENVNGIVLNSTVEDIEYGQNNGVSFLNIYCKNKIIELNDLPGISIKKLTLKTNKRVLTYTFETCSFDKNRILGPNLGVVGFPVFELDFETMCKSINTLFWEEE